MPTPYSFAGQWLHGSMIHNQTNTNRNGNGHHVLTLNRTNTNRKRKTIISCTDPLLSMVHESKKHKQKRLMPTPYCFAGEWFYGNGSNT